MAKMTPEQVSQRIEQMFKTQSFMLSQYQTLADNFYPERADFMSTRMHMSELADNLTDSYPVIVRRDLANSFPAMLRDRDWFGLKTDEAPGYQGEMWLERATSQMRKEMGRRSSGFARSTREGDHDFATFGQTVISVEPNMRDGGVLYRCWHLRDCAWFDDHTGQTAGVARRWRPTRQDLRGVFPLESLSPETQRGMKDHPFEIEDYRHLVIPAEMYGDDEYIGRFKRVSIFIDMKTKHIVEVKGINGKYYCVPRFHTISGSPYAYSPAAAVGLADARTLQAMTHTLLETAERYARPPMVATAQAITGVVDLAPDGITWVEMEYDERLGNALRPIAQDRGGFPIGASERERVAAMLTEAFYLNKISLPVTTTEMTAYEVQERMKQYRRQVLPLFSPIETDYNGQLCEETFEVMMEYGMFGSPRDIPTALRGADVGFRYVSPLTQTEQEEKLTQFNQTKQVLAEASQLDPTVLADVDLSTAMRDALEGNIPTKWLFPPEVAQETKMMLAAQQAAQAQAEQGAMNGQ